LEPFAPLPRVPAQRVFDNRVRRRRRLDFVDLDLFALELRVVLEESRSMISRCAGISWASW
jgi:hypothetical protein